MGSKPKRERLDGAIAGLTTFITDLAPTLSQTALAVAVSPYPFVPVIIASMVPAMIIHGKNALNSVEFLRLKEFVGALEKNHLKLDQEVIKTHEFAVLAKRVFDEYQKEAMEEKRKLLENYIVSAGSRAWDPSHDHSKLVTTLQRITPSQFSALVDIAKALGHAMEWDKKNHGKVTFQYDIGVILAILNDFKPVPAGLTMERMLDSALRGLASLDLVHIRDTSFSNMGGGSKSLEVINITALGHQLISYVSPRAAKRLLFMEPSGEDES